MALFAPLPTRSYRELTDILAGPRLLEHTADRHPCGMRHRGLRGQVEKRVANPSDVALGMPPEMTKKENKRMGRRPSIPPARLHRSLSPVS